MQFHTASPLRMQYDRATQEGLPVRSPEQLKQNAEFVEHEPFLLDQAVLDHPMGHAPHMCLLARRIAVTAGAAMRTDDAPAYGDQHAFRGVPHPIEVVHRKEEVGE